MGILHVGGWVAGQTREEDKNKKEEVIILRNTPLPPPRDSILVILVKKDMLNYGNLRPFLFMVVICGRGIGVYTALHTMKENTWIYSYTEIRVCFLAEFGGISGPPVEPEQITSLKRLAEEIGGKNRLFIHLF